MPATLDFFSSYVLAAIVKEVVPNTSFFRDRYFPTGEGDIIGADKVLCEYQDGDRTMAPFVTERVGDIPVERQGFQIYEYEPACIKISRPLKADELKKRMFGEALYANSDAATRAARLIADDFTTLDKRIQRREEWMAVQTMINNACTMQEYIDAQTKGEIKHIQFYQGSTDHTYTVANKWNSTNSDFMGDVSEMCRMLSKRGLPRTDLVLGVDAARAILKNEEVRQLLDKNSGIFVGSIKPTLTKYDGVTALGTLNFDGNELILWEVDEEVVDETGATVKLFPSTSAMVTAPNCGHIAYGAMWQIDYGATEHTMHIGNRIPKLSVNQETDIRKLRLGCKPLAMPRNKSPYIYAANVVS